MIKQLLLTAVIGSMSLGAFAATETFEFSYYKEPVTLGAIGASAVETLSAAMCMDQPSYAGMKVVKIDAYLNAGRATIPNLSETAVFLATNLPSAKPDILYAEVAPVITSFAGDDDIAVLSYTLPEPYVLTGDPIYAGYFVHVDAVKDEGTRHPILLDKNVINSKAGYLRIPSVTNGAWAYDSYPEGAVTVKLTLEYEGYQYSVSIDGIDQAYAALDKEFNHVVRVANFGSEPVSSLTYKYTIEGQEEVTTTYQLPEALPQSLSTTYNVSLPFGAVSELGEYPVDIEITQVNGNTNMSDKATSYFVVDVVPFLPKRRSLVEEFTNVKCGNCPRGYVAMEYISEEYPDDAVVICYHNDMQGPDPMTVTSTMPMAIEGNPSASINRTAVIDPYYGDYSNGVLRDLGVVEDLMEQNSQFALADIDVTATVDPETMIITATATTTFVKSVANDAYRVGYVLSCNGMQDPGNAKWLQDNYYFRDATIKDAPILNQCYDWPSLVQLVYNDVAVGVGGMRGVASTLNNVVVGEPIVNNYTFDISSIRNSSKESLEPYIHINNLVVNAFVVNRATGTIVNACKFPISRDVFDAVESVEAADAVVSTEYFDLTGCRVAHPANGIFIRSDKMSDGTVRTSKVVVK